MKKLLAALSLLCAGALAHADDSQTMRVTTPSGDMAIAIEQVKELTFGDTDMSVIKTDGSVLTFANELTWRISFMSGETSIKGINISNTSQQVKVYDLNGILIQELNGSESIDYGILPKGVYIVKSGDYQFKIQR